MERGLFCFPHLKKKKRVVLWSSWCENLAIAQFAADSSTPPSQACYPELRPPNAPTVTSCTTDAGWFQGGVVRQTDQILHSSLGRPRLTWLWQRAPWRDKRDYFYISDSFDHFDVSVVMPGLPPHPPPHVYILLVIHLTLVSNISPHIQGLWSALCDAHYHASHFTHPGATIIIINQNTVQSIAARQHPSAVSSLYVKKKKKQFCRL